MARQSDVNVDFSLSETVVSHRSHGMATGESSNADLEETIVSGLQPGIPLGKNDIPYRYKGALNPELDAGVCVPRDEIVNGIIEGIMMRGEYWSILGPRQIGKTTLLRQIERRFTQAHCVYLNFELLPTTEEHFYQWLMERLANEIPCETVEYGSNNGAVLTPAFQFLRFLERLKPKDGGKKIVLLFDEIEEMPSIITFLNVWRKIFHERDMRPELRKFNVIITGSVELITYTTGTNSPFNITEKCYLKDFRPGEVEWLVNEPMKRMGITVSEGAMQRIAALCGGHPQLLQHMCYILAEKALSHGKGVRPRDVDEAVNLLFKTNSNLETLKQDLLVDEKLKKLVRSIFGGEKKRFFAYKEYAIAGAGVIAEDDLGHCAVRNNLYKQYLKDILEISVTGSTTVEDSEFSEIAPVSRYKRIQEVGRGGMGTVYKAKDQHLKRIVALKIIDKEFAKEGKALKRFKLEARTIASLSHPNIVTVYDFGKVGEGYFISMEYIEGNDLLTLIKYHELTIPQIIFVAKRLFIALQCCHGKEIVHRDIKPQNIMVNHDGEIKIVDFGLATIKNRKKIANKPYIVGTPYYIAPEQFLAKKVDHRADIYSAGITLFRFITGRLPYWGDKNVVREQHLNVKLPVPSVRKFRPEVPDDLAVLVETCMAKKKENRFQDVSEILNRLDTLAQGMIDEATLKNQIKSLLPHLDLFTENIDGSNPLDIERKTAQANP